jgi:uncharacterized membrane protein
MFIIAVTLILGITGCLAAATTLSEVLNISGFEEMDPYYILITGCVLMTSVYLQIFFSYIVWADYTYLKECLLNPDSKIPRIS